MSGNPQPPSFEPRQKRNRPARTDADGRTSPAPAPSSDDAPNRKSILGAGDRTSAANPAKNNGWKPVAESAGVPAARPASSVPPAEPLPPSYAPKSSSPSPAANKRQPPPETSFPSEFVQTGPRTIAPPPYPVRKPRRRGQKKRWLKTTLALLLVALLAWPTWLIWHTNRSLNRVEAISEAPGTPGTTYLFAGSDSRDGWNPDDPTEGQRSDSVVLVHRARNGQSAVISLPRDSYVEIPGFGWNKLNAAFAFGGPQLTILTVEQMTGLTVDHYVEIGMGGVSEIVDALGGVELCWDTDVLDPLSGMDWTAGCHVSNGEQTLAFSRMRYEDPLGDFGRTQRQRQVLNAVASDALSPKVLLNPVKQYQLAEAGAKAITVGQNTNVWDIGLLMLTMRKAGSEGLMGPPPIASASTMLDVGSVVLLDEDRTPGFFDRLSTGKLTKADFELNW